MIINDISELNEKSVIRKADAEFQKRQSMANTHINYYNGEHAKQLVSSSDNIVFNLCKQVVDETVSFLLPQMPVIEGGDEAQFLNESWANAGGVTTLHTMATYGSITGHVFVMVTPNDDKTASITVIPTQNVIKYTLSQNSSHAVAYERRWDNERQIIAFEDGVWMIYEYTLKGRNWVLIQEPIQWAYSISPIIDWKHLPTIDSIYGMSDIPHYELNDDVNKIASDVNAILRYHASPTTIGVGFKADDIQATSIGGFWNIPNPDARVENLEMQSDLVASREMLNMFIDRFFKQARVVTMSNLSSLNSMTNMAVRATFAPMIAKNETLRRQYSEGIRNISRLMLEIAGIPQTGRLAVIWGDALPIDRREEVLLLKEQLAMGVIDVETVAKRLGNA
jgi:hypothetical protein